MPTADRDVLASFRRLAEQARAAAADGGPDLRGLDELLSELDGETIETLAASAAVSLTAVRDSRLDVLTRLLNRSALDVILAEEIDRAGRSGLGLTVLMLDLDEFKQVNDRLGHSAGDAVLREAGAALRSTVRSYDHVARLGGDEFVVVLPAADAMVAHSTARRLRSAVTQRAMSVIGAGVTCSIGLARWHDRQRADHLLDRADEALRAAKRAGRDRTVEAAEPAPSAAASLHVTEEPSSELLDALAGRRVRTLFQPIRSLPDDRLVGFEALSRGPGRLERPDALLAHARAAGRLTELDERLREHAFATATEAGVTGPLSVFVNIEPETLVALADRPELWHRHGEPFPSIAEVTERALFARPGRLIAACDRLRELGWGIALDDVGQDPRALALLPLVAPDVIKLDLRLLAERPPSELAKVVIAVTAEAQRSGARVLAEGIEGEEHLRRAAALGATLGQGWHFGRPEPLGPEIRPEEGHAPLPRADRPPSPRGITPFNLVASRVSQQRAGTELLTELQVDLERRALGLGSTATIATSLPDQRLDPGLPRRLRHLASDVGFAILLAEGLDPDEDAAFLCGPLRDEHELDGEWITVVTCPQYALTLVARPLEPPGTWSYALSHDNSLGLQTAQRLMVELSRAR